MKIEYIPYSDLDINYITKVSDYDNDAGLDIRLIHPLTIAPHSTETVGCGFGLKLPAGVMAQIITRSSISKKNITIGNAPIDASYTGEIHMMVSNNSDEQLYFEVGERLAQLVVIPIINFELVKELNTRDTNGLGSSGK
jgi:dUTP pyrophosphatase